MKSLARNPVRVCLLSFCASGSLCSPTCQDIDIPISANVTNIALPYPFSWSTAASEGLSFLLDLPVTLVSGTFTISASFCEPENMVLHRYNTLQILTHGVTYTKEYWTGLGQPENGAFNGTEYSWADYALQQGYPVLMYDRICNGNSTQLEGLLDCQVPLNADILTQIIQKARTGAFGGRNFAKIIPVGHSEGSVIAQYMAQASPNITDILILTGFTSQVIRAIPNALISGGIVPAAVGDSSPILDPTYLVFTDQIATENFFYYGDFSSVVADFDFNHRGTFAAGELATVLLGQVPAPDFTGDVFVLNGQNDAAFCAGNPSSDSTGPAGQCGYSGNSFSAQASALFPNARSYFWHQVNETGHCVNLHTTAQATFQVVHNYLESQGY